MKIKGLTHKMKNRIRAHGNEWDVYHDGMPGEFCITPKSHKGKPQPYMRWVRIGVDIELVKDEKSPTSTETEQS
jgi:hypothetical protein